jgi:hypothetical protein
MVRFVLTTAFLCGLSLTPALAATPCDGIWQHPLAEAAAVLAAVPDLPRDPTYEHMQAGPWHIVWVEPVEAEAGAHFITTATTPPRHVETWGGVAGSDETAEVIAWAMALDPTISKPLAECFAWYVTLGRDMGPPTWPNPFNRR